MFSKVALLSFIALATAAPQHQQAAQFPAGVNPALCPGFPICDNALLHNPKPNQWGAPAQQWGAPAAPSWNAQPAQSWNAHGDQWNAHGDQWNAHGDQWNAHGDQWNAPAAPHWGGAPALNGPGSNHLGAGGDKYPAGVNPHSCPNYPFCDNAGGHGAPQVAPLPGWTERQYPAGVSPHTCPNFPYCS